MKKEDLVLCGLPAVRARFERKPLSIEKLFFDYATGRKIGAICKALAQARRIYRCVEPAELEKISGTKHHGGIVAVVKAPPLREPTPEEIAAWTKVRAPVLVLDRIGNAHNLGAIARTAAFFGVPHLVIPADPAAARPSDAAYRVAEGGLEAIEVWRADDLGEFLRRLARAGYETVGAAVRGSGGRTTEIGGPRTEIGERRTGDGGRSTEGGGAALGSVALRGREGKVPLLPDRAAKGASKPVAIVLGNEETGLAPEVEQACMRLVTIPGSGKVESLNVSVAAAVLMWELCAPKRARS